MRGLLLAAFSSGLVLGSVLARDEASASRSVPWAPYVKASGISAQPDVLRNSLVLDGISGSIVADSTLLASGYRRYAIEIDGLRFSGFGVKGDLSFVPKSPHMAAPLTLLVRGGPSLDTGARISVAGTRFSGDGDAAFAELRELEILDQGGPVDRLRSILREGLRKALARIGGRAAGLFEALLMGSREELGAEEAAAFKNAGCAHILALSGQHLSVLAAIAVAVIKPIAGPRRAAIGAALLAAAFCWMAGAGPSLLRSVIMAWIGALALMLDRPQKGATVLSLAFIFALCLDPASARSLSFVLSYLAIAGLIVLTPRFEFALAPFMPPFLATAAAASLGAQFAVSPILAAEFEELRLVGIVASILAGPFVVLIMWWGLGAALLCSLITGKAGEGAAAVATLVSETVADLLGFVMRTAASVSPLRLSSPGAIELVFSSIVALAAFVYALPYVEHRFARTRTVSAPTSRASAGGVYGIQLSERDQGLPRGRGTRHVQALRPEFPYRRTLARKDSR